MTTFKIILAAGLLILGFMGTGTARAADPSACQMLSNALEANRDEQADTKDRIDEVKAKIKNLREATRTKKTQGSCDDCVPLAKDVCNVAKNPDAKEPKYCEEKDSDCAVELDPAKDVCWRIFKSPCYTNGLNAAQKGKVDKCWRVDNVLAATHMENFELGLLLKELDKLKDDYNKLLDRVVELKDKCTSPELAKAKTDESTRKKDLKSDCGGDEGGDCDERAAPPPSKAPPRPEREGGHLGGSKVK